MPGHDRSPRASANCLHRHCRRAPALLPRLRQIAFSQMRPRLPQILGAQIAVVTRR